ncbi:hypothetical protein EI427_01380 [Flammeovirga pectinis]|uniref:YHYH protein n=1 Tax=Flammeovirga pectinis TaxID=2494373 RepID=A0A3Q9FJ87_9BACT|nr:hypothetical protein [Flammeovirga pectinis]AZQ60911.1 hypothetical protein EI427_01380 [Flammeovirga pectinis]
MNTILSTYTNKLVLAFLLIGFTTSCVSTKGDDSSEVKSVAKEDNKIYKSKRLLSTAFDEFDSKIVSISLDGSEVIIESHGAEEAGTYWGNEEEETFEELGDKPSKSQNIVNTILTVPTKPNVVSSTLESSFGPVGIALNGAIIYHDNDNEGLNHIPLESQKWSKNNDNLIGVIADGFFLYGQKCASSNNYPEDLDYSGGHSTITKHSNEKIYHYHVHHKENLNTFYVATQDDTEGLANANTK